MNSGFDTPAFYGIVWGLSTSSPSQNAELFRRLCEAAGFHRIGFAPVGPVARHQVFTDWLEKGRAGDMHYLADGTDERRDPALLLAGAKTVVSVALSYAAPQTVPAERLGRGASGFVARYARGDDYHVVLKRKLEAVAGEARAALGGSLAYRVCVDTAPLLEREMAQASGIGFIAKNTMLIAPGLGSYVLLGELLVDVDCAPSAPLEPRCGQCRACLDACPTGAFVDAYVLDARRCISYWTIENEGAIPVELRRPVGTRIFGCDVCQEVCPFNGNPKGAAPELMPRKEHSPADLRALIGIGAAQFRAWQKGSALRRIHRPQLLRNVVVALGNVGTSEDLPLLVPALYSRYPLVRAHTAWAIGEIGVRATDARAAAHSLLRRRRTLESDAAVVAELDAALVACPQLAVRLTD